MGSGFKKLYLTLSFFGGTLEKRNKLKTNTKIYWLFTGIGNQRPT